jgi:signal transduction histidine kinase
MASALIAKKESLFKPTNKLVTNRCGLGLGLFICKSLIDLHKGDIKIDSEKGKGLRYWFITH